MLKAGFKFRPVEAGDLDMLAEWHRRPHVLEWWPDPPSIEELQESCGMANEHAADATFYVALCDGWGPVGFIQSYRAVAGHAAGWWLDEHDPGVVGIDQFLANYEQLDRGLGTEMIRSFIDILLEDQAVSRVQADPDPHNSRAIRSYVKAGFRPAREIDTPDGRALLMYRDR